MTKGYTILETTYNGHKFRSRLEARWACFFDELGIAWSYEPEGFDLGDGVWYLPDFWLPYFEDGIFVEVKHMGGNFSKPRRFSMNSSARVLLAEGNPGDRTFWISGKDGDFSARFHMYGDPYVAALKANNNRFDQRGPTWKVANG